VELAESAPWRGARQLEFERGDNAAAAAAYGRIARDATDVGLAARALQAEARCLVKAGDQSAALAILTGTLTSPQYREATDAQGHGIVANSQFLALQLLVDPASAEYRRTLTLLVQLLNDYGESSLSAGQRRLLMEQVAALDPPYV
jgi:hypothetical protein